MGRSESARKSIPSHQSVQGVPGVPGSVTEAQNLQLAPNVAVHAASNPVSTVADNSDQKSEVSDSHLPRSHSGHISVESTNGVTRLEAQEKDNNRPSVEPQRIILSFSNGDPENPYNWSSKRKLFILIAGIIAVINSTLGSSLPSGAIDYISKDFCISNEQQLVLPISLFLVGYVLGPVFFGPLSETYGRRVIMRSTFVIFTVFTMACALAPNWPSFLIFRFICGINASSAIAVVGGLYADVFDDPVIRGRAMAIFMAVSGRLTSDDQRQANFVPVHDSRSSISPDYIRFCIRCNLALDFLGRLNLCWSLPHPPALSTRDLWAHTSQAASRKNTQSIWTLSCFCAH